jgi:phospholipid/cholesterol/gamma-HCH transport system substrate-binding protein
MNESSNKNTVIVGLFVFLGLVFFIAGIFLVGDLHNTFKSKMEVVSLFKDVNGLKVGNNIWFSGVKIGTVNKLNFQGESDVKVIMSIEIKAQTYIHKNAHVKVSSDGFIGNKILVIYGGTSESAIVEEGDTLSVEPTFTTEDMVNTLQENNNNFLAISSDIKIISAKLVAGEGTIGKLLNDNSVYNNINAATTSLHTASVKAQELVNSLSTFSSGLNKNGTLAYELTNDTVVFETIKETVLQLQHISDTTALLVANLNKALKNPNSPIGILLHDEESGANVKEIIKNLESSSIKLDEDLKAAQQSFLLKGYFKKEAKANKSKPTEK